MAKKTALLEIPRDFLGAVGVGMKLKVFTTTGELQKVFKLEKINLNTNKVIFKEEEDEKL